ncbi:hypothetical protein BO70DRAFT_300805 [Aspergillus heteromorphus CBS 117.55]|uniref:Ell binding protein Ebp1 C-terminal domain-containing protein n=1 Tax=Aspergillus heteromorphus CBS 117.55 TaxID=1448321 RepID=A0A317V333_9EURO|nr:uncharacterized protein BO70DRAFT_300805 [Aspergillus heteromorphus CBS 117.55]PWY68049.1 hypothetical protein BO70DRAFT_300805 [Aspergillus heteromorphus CBS 117.55]
MSEDQPSRSADDEIETSKFPSEQTYSPRQDTIDQRLKRLSQEVLPFYPFLLTVPTDVPFHLGSRFVNNWAVSNEGPFTPEEQQLQYMTFLTHHEGDSLLVAVGDWSNATGNVMSDQRSGTQSATSTPSNNSTKKKISLNDYKNRRKSGTSASPISHETANQGPSTTRTLDTNDRGAKVGITGNSLQRPLEKTLPSQLRSASNPGSIERKRPYERNNELLRPQQKGPAPLKKPRLPPDLTTDSTKVDRLKSNGLPALLSPTLPPTSSSPRLPRLLSPTLPPDIEKELAKYDEGLLGLDSSQSGIFPTLDIFGAKMQKEKSAMHGPPQVDSVSFHNKASNHEDDTGLLTTADVSSFGSSFATRSDPQYHVGNTLQRPGDLPPIQQAVLGTSQLVVKLKYGRSNRKRVEALLKFSGKKKPALPNSPVKYAHDMEPSFAPSAGQKTPAFERSDYSKSLHLEGKVKNVVAANANIREHSKHLKVSAPAKGQTPIYLISNSATIPQDTPKSAKDTKFSSNRLELSGGNDGRSSSVQPAAKRSRTSDTPAKCSSPQSSNTASRHCDRRAWKDEYQKYGNLGRELKHAAERHTAKDRVTAIDEKLAAATAIEAILCFILAFVADDHSKVLSRQAADSSSWLSILAYWRVVRKNSAPYPRLHSLCLILGAVSYDSIHALDLERLAAIPLPGEYTPIPTPGSDETTVSWEENKKNRKELLELKSRLPECYRESQKLWLEGLRGISEDVLAREFPSTWSKRSKNFSGLGKQRLKAGEYFGEYFLPVARTATPLEIIRFSRAILSEWCLKEGVGWNSRLEL